jgi:hypothetical protein
VSLLIAEVYDALRAAHVPEEAARKAAEAMAIYEPALADLRADVRLLKWMLGTMGPLLIALVAGLYVVLFNLATRLPR